MGSDAGADHGLAVEQVPRANYPRRGMPAGTEPCGDGVTTDLTDLRTVPLADIAQAVNDGDTAMDETLRRIAPNDGSRVLLVAASFNSAI